jgi:hypothetical protein
MEPTPMNAPDRSFLPDLPPVVDAPGLASRRFGVEVVAHPLRVRAADERTA